MDLDFTDDQEELRHSVRAFLQRECPPSVVRAVVETGEPAAGLWAQMVGLDWPALTVPVEHGGMGLGVEEVAVLAEELGAAAAPGPYLPTATQLVPALLRAASAEQQARFLPGVAAGVTTGALALADHPARWQPGDVTAAARPVGGGWILDGRKSAVTLWSGEDELVVVARCPQPGRPDALGLFLVPAGRGTVEPVRSLDASRPLATVLLEGVLVEPDRVLGDPGDPAVERALSGVLGEAAVALALEIVGVCRTLFDLTLQHAKDRHQFGVPVGSFQAVKHKLADCHVALERARSLAYHAVAALSQDHPDQVVACAMAKAAAGDCQRLVCQEAIQTFGGIGFTWESDVHLLVKRAQSSAALLGSAAEHRTVVARALGVTR